MNFLEEIYQQKILDVSSPLRLIFTDMQINARENRPTLVHNHPSLSSETPPKHFSTAEMTNLSTQIAALVRQA